MTGHIYSSYLFIQPWLYNEQIEYYSSLLIKLKANLVFMRKFICLSKLIIMSKVYKKFKPNIKGYFHNDFLGIKIYVLGALWLLTTKKL